MASAISQFINTIRTAVYGEQVRGAIVSALEACYSDVENPDLQSAAFLTAINTAYASGILDITEVTRVNQMTNENIIYRYMGTEAGYTADTLYFYNGSAWVPIGSGVRTVNNSSLMTDTSAIYKYTGTQSGYINGALYYHNGTEWTTVVPEGLTAVSTDIQIGWWVSGALTNEYGAIGTGNRMVTAIPIQVKKGDVVVFSADAEAYRYAVRSFDENKAYKSDSGWQSSNYTIPIDGYIMIQIGTLADSFTADLASIAPSAFKLRGQMLSPYVATLAENASQRNLIDNSKLIGGYIGSDGNITISNLSNYGNEKATDFIEVEAGATYYATIVYQPFDVSVVNGWLGYAFYDENKTYIASSRQSFNVSCYSDANGNLIARYRIVARTGSKYIRFSFRSINGAFAMLTKGSFSDEIILSSADSANIAKIQTMPSPVTVQYPLKSISHRGYRDNGIPENTLPAYKRAAQVGYKFVETDVYELADGEFILFHNSTISINGTSKDVKDCTYEEIQTVTLGTGDYAGTPIPTFEEFLTLCKRLDLYPYIDMKYFTADGIKRIVQLVMDYSMEYVTTWITNANGYLLQVSQAFPQARIGSYLNTNIPHSLRALQNGRNEVFFDCQNAPSASILSACREYRIPIEVWTLNDNAGILALDPFITGVTSDTLIAEKVWHDANITLP